MIEFSPLVLVTALLFGLSLALFNWRLVFLATILVGFAQDPLRKITPGEPVYFVVLSTAVMAFALLGAMTRHGAVSVGPLSAGNRATRTVLVLLITTIAVQAVFSWLRYGSAIIAGIGLLSYLSPIPATWLAYHYTRGVGDIRRFLLVYLAGAILVTSGIYASAAGISSPLLGQVGEGIVIYDIRVGRMETHSGLMRSPEVAAWHAAAAACVAVVLAASFRSQVAKVMTPLALLFFGAAAVFTGRRKALVMVITFLAMYLASLQYYRHRSARRGLMFMGVVTAAVLGSALFIAPSGSISPYLERGQSVFGDVGDRFVNLGLASIAWGINAGGFFGLGTGVGSQGTQHFTGGSVIAGGAAEGGLGKIVVELGVPGLLLVLIAMALVFRNVRRILDWMAAGDRTLLPLYLGMVAICGSNVPMFLGASQIYGDPFVLMLLGSFLGFVLGAARPPRVHQVQPIVSAVRAPMAVGR